MNDCNNRVLVLVDDFIGVNDVGVSLVEVGMLVEVVFIVGQLLIVWVLIFNSDSWVMIVVVVVDKVVVLLCGVVIFVLYWQVKKIDFMLCGNFGGELEVMMVV